MEKTLIALIGAGNRGTVYADFIHRLHPEVEIRWVADIDPQKRLAYGARFGLPQTQLYEDADQMLDEATGAQGVIIANMEHEHCRYTLRALSMGYHVLLEKPMSNDPKECLRILQAAQKTQKVLMVCHVLRYTPFFATLKQMIASGRIGGVMSIQHAENVSYTHMAHSYVRGNFRRSDLESPMLLAKSCHDMDLMLWLADAPCTKVSSFGSLSHFRNANVPVGAPPRCTDGCQQKACPFDARKYYLGADTQWPISMISGDLSLAGRRKALEEGPYGRCVYYCDNNVVDHQVVNLLFKNGVTATFSMNGFNKVDTRVIKVAGTLGEITGELYQNELHVRRFDSDQEEIIHLPRTEGIHGGGDSVMVAEFVQAITKSEAAGVLTNAAVSVQGHLITFAAEAARLSGQVVDIEDYTACLQA